MSKAEHYAGSAPPMPNDLSAQPVPPTYTEAVKDQPAQQMAPPPMGFAMPHQQGPTTAVYTHQPQMVGPPHVVVGGVVQPIITTVIPVGPSSTHVNCPNCHAEIHTTVVSRPSTFAYISGAFIALLGCWMGCCLIPCFMDSCMDKQHTCPNCKSHVGYFRAYDEQFNRNRWG